MVTDVLLRLKPELALNLDADDHACGTYVGYGFTLKALSDKNCIIFNSWARKSALTTKVADDFFKDYMSKPENSFVKAYKAGEPNISAVLFAGNDDAQAATDIKRFITDVVKYYSANYYSNACSKCNSSIGLTFAKASDGNIKQLCKMCIQSEEDTAEKAAMMQAQTQASQPVQTAQAVNTQPMPDPTQQPVANQPQQTAQNVGLYGIPTDNQSIQPQAANESVVMPATNADPLPIPKSSGDTMAAIDPTTAPESTGYSTAQSLAELKPPTNSNLPPINGGFSQPAPMNNGGFVQRPMNNGYSQQPMNSFGNDGRFVAGRPTAIVHEANPVMGILGAILFSLIGCAVWILIGKLGYISYLGGVAMAFSTIFGYNLFGKKFDVLGFIVSIVIVLLMVLFSNMIIMTWEMYGDPDFKNVLELMGYNSFFSVFLNMFNIFRDLDMLLEAQGADTLSGLFIRDLVVGYLVSGIATFAIGLSMLKKSR